MNDIENVLTQIGLTKGEAVVYLALLSLGPSTTGRIVDASNIARSWVYTALSKLHKRGLVSTTQIGMRTQYEAAKPEQLLNVVHAEAEEKENEIRRVLPQLRVLPASRPDKVEVQVLYGVAALRDILSRRLVHKEPILVFGVPSIAPKKIGYGWLEEFHAERTRQKIIMKHIYSEAARERVKYLKKLPYTEVRVLPGLESAEAINICGDEVSLVDYLSSPIRIIFIKSVSTANTYKRMFNELWSKAH